jgi:Lrp/AsnC family transcriptional regulator, leucine-responsive regulatory protein
VDTKDQQLLQLLQRDGRAPILTLARAIGLSRSATQARVSRLVKDGYIRRFTAIVDDGPAPKVIAHALIKLEPGKTCAMTVPHLRKVVAATSIHSVTGPHDLVVRLEAATIAEIEQARSMIAGTNGVGAVMTMMVLERHLG